ncbi:MAG: endolytic transglycosylase MltG [Spirochaetes bacterium]|nr:endolytic transglycosylase MltG [Spirochaetota bacterium]
MKTFLKTFLLLFIIIICALITIFLWLGRPTGNIQTPGAEFEIIKGDTAYSVSKRLYARGYIHSKELFIIITRVFRLDKNLKTGWVELAPNNNTVNLINLIYGNKFVSVAFTVPEGSTVKQIKEILINNEIADRKSISDFLSQQDYPSQIGLVGYKSAEGFLFPDTYKFYKGVAVEKIFSTMVKLFYTKLEEIYPSYKTLNKKELRKKIIIASIIEKEIRLANEAPIVSGIFYNRINIGMKIQSCATVQYILEKPKEQLLESDLLINHPYNTYIYKGLPPGPICNPGFTAIKSAFYPDKHDYLFFVVKDPEKGSHYFSKTYKEHLEAQKRYKKIRGLY